MGSREDTDEKALALTGLVTRQLLRGKDSVRQEDIISALNRLSHETSDSDWAVRVRCEKAVKMMKRRMNWLMLIITCSLNEQTVNRCCQCELSCPENLFPLAELPLAALSSPFTTLFK